MSGKSNYADVSKTKRYLVEIRGVLHIDAPDAQTAQTAALAWIEAVSFASEAKNSGDDVAEAASSPEDAEPVVVRVGWLRPFPD